MIGPYEARRCPGCGLMPWADADLQPDDMVCTCDDDGTCYDPYCCAQPDDDGHGDLRQARGEA